MQVPGQYGQTARKRVCRDAGKGISALIGTDTIRLGSGKFLFGHFEEAALSTRVHIMINAEYLGYFTFTQSYRHGLDKVARLSPPYRLFLVSGDQNHERKSCSVYSADQMHFDNRRSKNWALYTAATPQGQVMMVGVALTMPARLSKAIWALL
jgi:Cu+-exporting ATPase